MHEKAHAGRADNAKTRGLTKGAFVGAEAPVVLVSLGSGRSVGVNRRKGGTTVSTVSFSGDNRERGITPFLRPEQPIWERGPDLYLLTCRNGQGQGGI